MKKCSKKKLRFKRSALSGLRKFISAVALALVFLCLLGIPFKAVKGLNETFTREYIVRDGDTLWALAEDICPNGTRLPKVIYEIKKLNQMESSAIYAGKSLLLPIY